MEDETNKLDIHRRRLLFINFSIVAYFLGIYYILENQIFHIFIVASACIFTVPFLIAQVFFIFVSLFFMIKKNRTDLLLIGSLGLLVANQLYILIIFF